MLVAPTMTKKVQHRVKTVMLVNINPLIQAKREVTRATHVALVFMRLRNQSLALSVLQDPIVPPALVSPHPVMLAVTPLQRLNRALAVPKGSIRQMRNNPSVMLALSVPHREPSDPPSVPSARQGFMHLAPLLSPVLLA